MAPPDKPAKAPAAAEDPAAAEEPAEAPLIIAHDDKLAAASLAAHRAKLAENGRHVRCVNMSLAFLSAGDLAKVARMCPAVAASGEIEAAWREWRELRELRAGSLRRVFGSRKLSAAEADALLATMDPGGTGRVSKAAFTSAMGLWRIDHGLDRDHAETMKFLWDCEIWRVFESYLAHSPMVDSLVDAIGNCFLHGVSAASRSGYAEMRRRARMCGITTEGDTVLVPPPWTEFERPPRLYQLLMRITEGHDADYLPRLGMPGSNSERDYGPLDESALPWITEG